MKILFAKKSKYIPEVYAGTELSTHFLCHILKRCGHETAVAATSDITDYDKVAINKQLLGYSIFRSRDFDGALQTAIERIEPDVLVLQDLIFKEPVIQDMPQIISGELPVLLYLRSLPYVEKKEDQKRIRLPEPDKFVLVVNSEYVANFLEPHGYQATIVHSTFGIERFSGQDKWNGNTALCMSIQKRKGTDIAIKLAKSFPEIPFTFVESWTQNEGETEAMKAHIMDLPNTKIIPNSPNIEDVYISTKLLIMPSRSREAWGRTASEAQTFGIPVLGSNRGNLPHTIGPGGVVLDPEGDIELWKQALERIWNDAEYYRELSIAGKKHVTRLINDSGRNLSVFIDALNRAVELGKKIRAETSN